ncbi:fatty acid--CoA ligase family protein [Streptomyces sp. WMMC500]|uniref:class I adenylate-forming enzyme family protein n=1 Tax=Streptomyces sp. WMMC500 TaxID=3015154 RepID=UPI00248D2C05|nr:fatty acid--CoA ligase family protein [Streptomyces sp. WMMC500]WBB61244.1 fatty acid--CoA ligase family protein [Streptomyces sp. WMMC500]
MSLSSFLLEHPAAPGAPVVHWPDGAFTLGELTGRAETLARLLGPVERAPVACVVDSGPLAVTAMFATWLAGGVYVPVNARLTDAEVAGQTAAADPAAVIASSGQAARVSADYRRLVHDGGWTVGEAGRSRSGGRFGPHVALVMRTSGTTGASKPVVLEHEGVRKGIDAVVDRLRGAGKQSAERPMPNLVPSSLALWAGIWNTLFALRLGAEVVLLDPFDPADYAAMVKRFGIRSTILAPPMMTMLCDDPRVTDLRPLRYVRSVTAPLSPAQARRFHERFGVGVLNSYGQTELGGEVVGWTAADLREHGAAKLGAVGRPHGGVEVRILDQDGVEAAPDAVGEIWIRSPFASPGADLPRDRLRDGFLRTGDLGRLDPEGFLWIEGRVSDMINRGGLKVVPDEVEEVLRDHPGVADACVAGVPDARLGEVPVAWVRPVPGRTPPPVPEDLRAFVRSRLAGYKVPVAVHLVDDFPRTEIGKVVRRTLVARLTGEDHGGTDPA